MNPVEEDFLKENLPLFAYGKERPPLEIQKNRKENESTKREWEMKKVMVQYSK